MFRASRYWKFVRIDATSRCVIQDLYPAKLLYRRLFAELPDQTQIRRREDISCLQILWLRWYVLLHQTQFIEHRLVDLWLTSLAYQLAYLTMTSKLDQWVQRQLLMLNQDESLTSEDRLNAELSLRCYISEQIRAVCVSLGAQFGASHGFAWYDLLPFVMDDTDPTRSILQPPPAAMLNRDAPSTKPYDYLAGKILRGFEPDRSSLATWTNMLTRQHQPLKAFLLEHGIYLISDWALLNDTEPKVLRRILAQTYGLPTDQIEQACLVLNCYHEVYRTPYRRSRTRGGCQPPTIEQLHQMIAQANLTVSPKALMRMLLELAGYLRQYRICRKGGPLPADSIDAWEASEQLPASLSTSQPTNPDEDDQTTFLDRYRQQLITCLDQAIASEIQQRYDSLQRRASTAAKSQVFLAILKRYYCDRIPMTTIAAEVGLKGQFEVTRLLKIKEFRSAIRQRMLHQLRDCVLELAKEYAHPDCLQRLDQQVEAALNEYLDQVILEPSIRSNADQVHPDQNLFVQRLCCVIQRFS